MKYFAYTKRNGKQVGKTCFMYWENMDEYVKFSETQPLSSSNKNEYASIRKDIDNPSLATSLYDNARTREDIASSIKSFRHFAKYEAEKKEFIDNIKNEDNAFKMDSLEGRIRKLDFNDLGLGVFCFSRAAMQLRRKKINGETKVISDVKKVYGYFPQKKGNNIVVRMMLPMGLSHNQGQKQLFYNALASIVAAEYLINKEFDVEIYARMTLDVTKGKGSRVNYATNIIKLADSKISPISESDIERILIMMAEVRFYRSVGFLNSIKICDFFGIDIDANLGYPYPGFEVVREAEDRLFPSENMIHQETAFSFIGAKRSLMRLIEFAHSIKHNTPSTKRYSYVQNGDASTTQANVSGVITYEQYLAL